MKKSLVSVIVPIYNVESFLDECMQSIASQTYENLEIILVDDGSPDNCPAMCDAWAEKDSRIKVIHKENGGLSDARNAGLAIATGALIAFVDSDDRIEPDFIRELYAAMERTGADIAECGVAYVDETGAVLKHRPVAPEKELDRIGALRRLVLEDGVYQTVWNKLYRREVLDGIPFEKGKYHEDDFWTYQVFDRIEKLALVEKPLYNYLQRGGSIIGVGYNLKRLDGLEARFLRMEYLQKYPELAALTRQSVIFDCMWHLQSVLRHTEGAAQESAIEFIFAKLKATPKVSQKELTANWKYHIWFALFTTMPILTAHLRNALKIGI